MSTFRADVDAIIAKTQKRMTALLQGSVERVIDDAQLPTGKGGRMHVDTGFLRASGQGSFDGLPTGPSIGESKEKNAYDDESEKAPPASTLLLGQMKPGVDFWFGWVAGYAVYREAYDGFLEGAVQKWPQFVAEETAKIKARIP